MGMLSDHTITVMNIDQSKPGSRTIIPDRWDYSRMYGSDVFDIDTQNPLQASICNVKWYEMQDDMKTMSLRFPLLLFKVVVSGDVYFVFSKRQVANL
jgi:hypothetical protein